MAVDLEKYKFLEGLEKDAQFIFEGLKIRILEKIVVIMKIKGINRAELARKLGTSRAYVTRMLRADVNFTMMKLVKIAQALGTELMVDVNIPEINISWPDKITMEVEHKNEPLFYAKVVSRKTLPDEKDIIG